MRTPLTLLVLAAAVIALAARPAVADDRVSIDEGRTAARGLLLVRDPRACGIAVLRERCMVYADAFLRGRGDDGFAHVPNIGPHPATGLRAFVANGDRDSFDRALSWINNLQADEPRWRADARSAALYDAGILDVFFPAANGDPGGEMLASFPALDLAKHTASIPAGTPPIDLAALREVGADVANGRPNVYRMPHLVPFTKALVAAVDKSAPEAPLATLPRGDAPTADAALGVAFATMAELIDSPPWAAQGDAEAFATALADRLDTLVPVSGRADVAAFRANVRAGASFNHDRANAALTAASTSFEKSVPRERAQRFAFGAVAAQLAYNAAILRSPETSAALLRVVAASSLLDAPIPGWAEARAGAASVGSSDWLAQHAYALRLVGLIQKANPA